MWKRPGERLSKRMVSETVKHEGENVTMWECMRWDGSGYAARINDIMAASLYVSILKDEMLQSLKDWSKTQGNIIFQQNNYSRTPGRRPCSGSKIMICGLWCGLHSIQTSILLNTYDNIIR